MTENKNNNKTQAKPVIDERLREKLTSGQFQKGLMWRKEKLEAVAQARSMGISDEEIFGQLKIAGLMDITARSIMKDAYYLDGIASDGSTENRLDSAKEINELRKKKEKREKP